MSGGAGLDISSFATLRAILDPGTVALSGNAQLSYHFEADGQLTQRSFFTDGSELTRAWSDGEKDMFRAAMAQIESFASVDLVEVNSRDTADVKLQMVDDVPGGHAGYVTNATMVVSTARTSLITHEFGHMMGLGHPHDTSLGTDLLPGVEDRYSEGDFGFNSDFYSVMAYRHGALPELENTEIASVIDFSVLDIAALQYLYGSNDSYASGDTRYLTPDRMIAIWDTGGDDTIDFSAEVSDSLIDLRAATLLVEAGGLGRPSVADANASSFAAQTTGYLIAHDVVIENGLSALGDDTIIGNDAANVLISGAGDDSISGGLGDDTIDGGVGFDVLTFDVPSEGLQVSISTEGFLIISEEGRDVVVNVESFQFTDQLMTQAQLRAMIGNTANINGTSASEVINAGDGGDWITPGAGSDTVDGGDGRDMVSFVNLVDTPGRAVTDYRLTLNLEAGTATTSGGDSYTLRNVERVTATINEDFLRGDAGDNELRGLGAYDWFVATTGNDIYDGGNGKDMLSFLEWTSSNIASGDVLDSGAPLTGAAVSGVLVDLADSSNNTNLAAGHAFKSIERITGSGREDVFYGDDQENDFRGLGGYDWFVGSTGGRERYFGGDGLDTVTYYTSTSGITASLSNGARVGGAETGRGTGGDAARDLYFEIENLVGTDFGDTITGNAGRNQLNGLEGDDFLYGLDGVDRLKGGAGNDVLDGGEGSDYAFFDGNMSEYTLDRTSSNEVTVTHASGVDRAIDIETFSFADQDITIWDLSL